MTPSASWRSVAPSSRGATSSTGPRQQPGHASARTLTRPRSGGRPPRRAARRAARRTRAGAVPPRPSREATEPSTVSTSRTPGRQPRVDARRSCGVGEVGELDRRAPRTAARTRRRARGPPGTARPRAPATPRRRWPARSPAGPARPSASVSKTQRGDLPGERRQQHLEGVHGVEDRLLVLLEVAVVGQRQRLQGGQQPGEVADQPAGLAAGELGDVGVLLLRHDARPGRVAVVEPHEAELPGRPEDDLLGLPRRRRRRSSRARRPARRRSRARRCRRWSWRVEPVEAQVVRRPPPGRGRGWSRPARPSRTASRRPPGRPSRGSGPRRGASGQAWASRWWLSSTGWACWRCVRPGMIAPRWASAWSAQRVDEVEHHARRRSGRGRAGRPEQRGDLVVAAAAGAQLAAELGPEQVDQPPLERAVDVLVARGRGCSSPAATAPVEVVDARPACRRQLVVGEQAGRRQHPGVGPRPREVVGREPPVEVGAARQRLERRARAAGEAAAPEHAAVGGAAPGRCCRSVVHRVRLSDARFGQAVRSSARPTARARMSGAASRSALAAWSSVSVCDSRSAATRAAVGRDLVVDPLGRPSRGTGATSSATSSGARRRRGRGSRSRSGCGGRAGRRGAARPRGWRRRRARPGGTPPRRAAARAATGRRRPARAPRATSEP